MAKEGIAWYEGGRCAALCARTNCVNFATPESYEAARIKRMSEKGYPPDVELMFGARLAVLRGTQWCPGYVEGAPKPTLYEEEADA